MISLDEQKRVTVFAFGTTGFPSPRFLCSLLSALSQALSEQNVEPFSVIITQPELSPADLQCREFLDEEDGGEQITPPRKIFEHGTIQSMQFKGLGDVMMPWIPQRAVLAHENVLLFGTHCGFELMSEALLAYPFHSKLINLQMLSEWLTVGWE